MKKDKGTIEPKKIAKIAYDQYIDFGSFKEKPVSEAFIEHLGQELVEWAIQDEDALKITQFFTKKRIYSSDIARWRERSKKFDGAYRFALTVIGDRRELGALRKKLDGGMVSATMSLYDSEWKNLIEWKAQLKENSGVNREKELVVVNMPTWCNHKNLPK